jgi:subtilisin family serine protease
MTSETTFYIVDGQQLPLNRVHSARLVTPAREYHQSHVAARLARSSRIGIETAVPKQFLVVRGDANKMEEIRGYEDVRHTRSVFTDRQGRELILTDEILVKFAASLPNQAREALCEKLNCLVLDATGDIWRLRILDAEDDAPLAVANKLYDEPDVEFAEPNMLQSARFEQVVPPSDTFFPNQWHLHNTGQGGGTVGADVRALEAWESGYGYANIRVVVHDSGVDIGHLDLQDNILPGWDFDNDDSDASNPNGPHGTGCAGVIAAVRNGQGVVGTAPGCKLVPLRAAGAHTWSTWAETFRWAASKGDIISCSWTISPNSTLTTAITEVVNTGRGGRGIPVLCATGNDWTSWIGYPASLAETIAIGASTNRDVRAGYSQYGTGLDVVAPSSGGTRRIETTDVRGVDGYNTNPGAAGDYCKAADSTGFGGTSSATPLTAGVAALMLSANPLLTATEVRDILRATAVQIDPANANYNASGWSSEYGYGRVDAAAAVAQAAASAPEIIRTGDSGSQAGYVGEITAVKVDDQVVVTAVRTQSFALKLISWRVGWDGSVSRLGDSGSQAGRASNLSIAKGSKFVVACRTSSGDLKLISWDISASGAITRAGDSGSQAGRASKIKLVALTNTLFVSACRTGEGTLKLITWRLEADGSLTRLQDSGAAAGEVSRVSLIEIPRAGTGRRVVTAVRTAERALKLIVWDVSTTGTITRKGDSGSAAGAATMIRSVLDEHNQVITSARAANGTLKLIAWDISSNGNTVTRLGDSGSQAGYIRDNALMPRPGGVVSAVRTRSGDLKLISWSVSGSGSITRTGDSDAQAGTASLITLCHDALSDDIPIVASVRTESRNLKLITWRD